MSRSVRRVRITEPTTPRGRWVVSDLTYDTVRQYATAAHAMAAVKRTDQAAGGTRVTTVEWNTSTIVGEHIARSFR